MKSIKIGAAKFFSVVSFFYNFAVLCHKNYNSYTEFGANRVGNGGDFQRALNITKWVLERLQNGKTKYLRTAATWAITC